MIMEYEEKLNLAKKALESGSYDKNTIEYIFPELKESEEERVKRILYSILGKISHLRDIFTEEEFQYFDVWLKEQYDKPQGKLSIEPKFKVGDWIANNKGHAFLIEAIEDNKYLFEDGGYTHEQLNSEFIENADKCYHLWSFDEDAEDGDVLVHTKHTSDDFDYIFIYNKTYIYQTYGYYSKEEDGFFILNRSHHSPWNKEEGIMPATKKQRDFFRSKVKEAHFDWDAKNKTFKWIGPMWC